METAVIYGQNKLTRDAFVPPDLYILTPLDKRITWHFSGYRYVKEFRHGRRTSRVY